MNVCNAPCDQRTPLIRIELLGRGVSLLEGDHCISVRLCDCHMIVDGSVISQGYPCTRLCGGWRHGVCVVMVTTVCSAPDTNNDGVLDEEEVEALFQKEV